MKIMNFLQLILLNSGYDSNHLPRYLPSNPLTSPNNLEQGLSVIEFDKKSDSISLVFVKLFKTQNELSKKQDTKTLLFILILINILWINKNGNK